MTEPDPLPSVRISRFGGLNRHEVLEVHDTAWPEFLAHLEADPLRAFRGKYDHPGWSPAVFDPPVRDRANVRSVSAVVIDFNKGTPFERAVEGWAEWFGVVYTTKGHTADASRLRIVLPLTRAVSADEHGRIWSWVAGMCTSMGLTIADEPADPAAFWYDATTPRGGWRSARLTGAVLDPGPILATTPPAPKPPAPALRLITAADLEPPALGTLAAPPAPTWRDQLRRKGDGFALIKSYGNCFLIVKHHDAWAGRWSFNEMTLSPMFDGRTPTAALPDVVRRTIETNYGGLSPSRHDVECAMLDVALERPFHPVRDYLRSLQWDGTERLLSIARDVLGDDRPLQATLLRKWFLSAVARPMSPGCKVDTMLVLVGPTQGLIKSTFFRALTDPWFSDSKMNIESKDSLQNLQRAWVHEWSELERVVNERTDDEVKGFISSQTDLFRAPYAHAPEYHPRTSVLVGSTNKTRFLTDPTGSRRYWPVKIRRRIDVDTVRKVRDQLWAEAVALFDAADTCPACAPILPWNRCEAHRWWLTEGEELTRETDAADHQDEDPWDERIDEWLRRRPSIDAGGQPVPLTTTGALTGIGVPTGQMNAWSMRRAAAALKRLGWTKEEWQREWSPPGAGRSA